MDRSDFEGRFSKRLPAAPAKPVASGLQYACAVLTFRFCKSQAPPVPAPPQLIPGTHIGFSRESCEVVGSRSDQARAALPQTRSTGPWKAASRGATRPLAFPSALSIQAEAPGSAGIQYSTLCRREITRRSQEDVSGLASGLYPPQGARLLRNEFNWKSCGRCCRHFQRVASAIRAALGRDRSRSLCARMVPQATDLAGFDRFLMSELTGENAMFRFGCQFFLDSLDLLELAPRY